VIFGDPGVDYRLELIVAGNRVAKCPFAHRRETGLRRAVGVDDGFELRVELRRDRLELRAEARPRDRQHMVALHQPAHGFERLGFRCLRIVTNEIDRQPADAALGIDLLDGDLHRHLGRLAPLGALAGERHLTANLYIAAGELGSFAIGDGQRHHETDGNSEPRRKMRCTFHGTPLGKVRYFFWRHTGLRGRGIL